MRKWTYLVAALLMAGTTATFTGCIDTDEPEGIVNLRGAKAELIKAEASVKLVEVEMEKARVAQVELQNKALELQNKNIEYDNQLKALTVKQKELELEMQQAKNEVEKAKLQNAIAQANAEKEAIENAKALAAESFKSQMLAAQTATAHAQAAYEQALKDLELAKLTLSATEQQKITTAQNFLTSAATVMNQKYTALNTAQTNYYNALVNPNLPTLGKLQAELALAQVAVEKAEIMLDKQSETLALVEDFDAVAWDKKKSEYKKQISEYESSKAKAELKETEVKNSADYKAADKKVVEAGDLRAEANTMYNGGTTSSGTSVRGAKSDSIAAMAGTIVNGVSTQLAIKNYVSDPINASLIELFGRVNPFTSGSGYDARTGVFSYASGSYSQGAYLADDETQPITAPWQKVNTVKSWIEILDKYSVDGNGVAWSEIGLKNAETEAAAKKVDFDVAKKAWEIIVKAVKEGKATTVPTSVKDSWDIQATVAAYNTDYKALADAIAAYNTEYDSKYKTAYDASIDKWKTDEKKIIEFDLMYAVISAKPNLLAAYNSFLPTTGTITIDIRINTAKTVLTNLNAGAGIPGAGAISDELDIRYTANKATIENTAKGKGLAAVAGLSNAKITAADTKVKADLAPLRGAMNGYIALASYPYVQVPVTLMTIDDLTGTGNFYETAVTDGKTHYKALRKSISTTGDGNDYAKFTATKLKTGNALTSDLGNASDIAFGSLIPTTGEAQRLTEVTEEMVREHALANSINDIRVYGQLGKWMYAKDQVQYYKDLVNAKDLILALKTQIEGVLTNLNAEIQTNSEKIQVYVEKANEARIALSEAQVAELAAVDERDALLAEVDAEKQKFAELIADMNALISTVDAQISSIAAGTGNNTVAEVIAYWKNEVAIAGKTVETKKQELAAKEKAIKLFNDGEYTEAYALAQKKAALDSATDEYTTAKTVYDMALSQLKALITALTK